MIPLILDSTTFAHGTSKAHLAHQNLIFNISK